MTRIVYLNGDFVDENKASLPIFDRGLLFADSVYEGFGVLDENFIDFEGHFARLCRSLATAGIVEPFDIGGLYYMLKDLISRNGMQVGFVYLQITRGTQSDRDFLYPEGLTPNVFAFGLPQTDWFADTMPQPISMLSTPDLRWVRRDIKTTNLLAQVMVKNLAKQAGADEALMIDSKGNITEGGSTSFFIIKDNTLYARPLSNDILHGVTRKTMLSVADQVGLAVTEQKYTLDDVFAADEAFHTAASFYVKPVGVVDGKKIGDGNPGPFTHALRMAYLARIRYHFYQPDTQFGKP